MRIDQVLGLFGVIFAITGCAADVDEDEPAESSEDALWAQKKQKWPAKNGVTRISVCWETRGLEATKTSVRAALAESWSAVAKIDFVGFHECNTGKADLRVRFADGQPHVRSFGESLRGVRHGVTLNWPGTWCVNNPACDRAMVLHEFGHALGFLHEQDRKDAPPRCPDGTDQHTGTDVKGMILGAYDPRSIMNYCRQVYSDATLSAGDIEGARKWYGTRS